MDISEKIAASIICNYIALHYNEEIKHTNIYKHELKKKLNLSIQELQKAEVKEFDKIFDMESDMSHRISSNLMLFIEEICKNGFSDMLTVSNIILAHKKNPKAVEGILNKVLNQV